ncbi:beta-propeller domain-containing protein [Planococcus sp. CAU13]|uniref:beta-propeller domain-containing protein n=1 Tax=Planococcus sp. CAU13 TaxID=1541197 RepID=UPI00052FECEC|nr:beta-propeller domain-containing protein [Planococcus sp. CAU13]
MKKRSLWLLAAAIIAAIGIGFAFMIDKVSISASTVALAEQGWRANFSSALHSDAIEKGYLYLTDADEEPVNVEMTLLENGKTLEIPQISTGNYILHIKKSAIKGKFLKSLSNDQVAFSVQEKITALSTEEELKDYFRQLLELQKNTERYGAFGEGSGMETSESASSDTAGSGEGGSHSSTNNQVEGVDEADLVKTDGSYIYSISESRVIIMDARYPDDLSVGAEIVLEPEMYPQQLFLSDNTLVVMGSEYNLIHGESESEDEMQHISMTSLFFYDISDPASPRLLRKIGTEGNLNGARLTNGILYYVTNVYPNIWMMEEQEDVELRPRTYDSKDGEELSVLPFDRISILPGTMEGSYSIVSAIDLADPQENELSTDGFLGGSEQLYMTKESLYLTAAAYVPLDEQGTDSNLSMDIWIPQIANTEIFKFALDGTTVEFVASSEVKGSLLNQFSMDEYNGYFRIATTEGFAWDEAAPSKNHLFILDGGMEQVGSVEDLAKGERIYSARFMGDKAYMVTFKETDPLFVIDVSAPSAPEVLGELKIPGFSNYLHPLGEDHLIGFGSDTHLLPSKEGEARVVTGGMKISLFDVSDFENPLEKDTEIIGGQGTSSALQYDHKALFTHSERNLYGFPINIYRETKGDFIEFEGQGALIYTITPQGIEQTANLLKEGTGQYEDWNSMIQRIIYIDETIYTIANSEIRSYDLNTFEIKDTIEY